MRRFIVWFFLIFPWMIWPTDHWMEHQIAKDLQYFKHKKISLCKLNDFYENKAKSLALVKYEIFSNKVVVDSQHVPWKAFSERVGRYKDVLTKLCETKGLPNSTMLIALGDGLNAKEEMPIFGMCKMDSDRIILIPDYEALGSRYQVLKYDNIDIVKAEFPWENKLSQLIWRGSTAQYFWKMTEKNMDRHSRVTLCKLSESYPSKIDAKFTLFVQEADKIAEIYRFQGEHVSFRDQMNYKYHVLIDGNVSPYTKSGWKFFANALIFKPHSMWIQWYFEALEPSVHYIPVEADLSDLVTKLDWAIEHDLEGLCCAIHAEPDSCLAAA